MGASRKLSDRTWPKVYCRSREHTLANLSMAIASAVSRPRPPCRKITTCRWSTSKARPLTAKLRG